jgi:hypothetical protein
VPFLLIFYYYFGEGLKFFYVVECQSFSFWSLFWAIFLTPTL